MDPSAAPPLRLPSATAPWGFRWALVVDDPDAFRDRRGEITRFDRSPDMKKFQYDGLSSMTGRIRLLRLMAGPETSEVQCELFEADIDTGVFMTSNDQDKTRKEVSYEALSWSWGTGTSDHRVLIRKNNKVERKRCSEGLAWALRYLRYEDKDRTIWVDAICIDQDSIEEKNHQVKMMAQIYSYASQVCIWLGLGDKASHMAIKFIKEEILRLEQFDALCSDERNAEKWQSLLLLMQRPWFFRRWVVQEIALAKDAIIYCGPDKISWKDFSVAVELFVEVETVTHRLSEVMQRDSRFYHIPRWFEYVSALGASLLVEATGMIFRYYKTELTRGNGSSVDYATATGSAVKAEIVANSLQSSESENDSDSEEDDSYPGDEDVVGVQQSQTTHGSRRVEKATAIKSVLPKVSKHDPISSRRPLLSLEYLVSKLSIFAATEPRDAIYALLAISNDAYPSAEGPDDKISASVMDILSRTHQRKPFPVDYGQPYADVCQTFFEFCIGACPEKSRALDILCRPWALVPTKRSSLSNQSKAKMRGMPKLQQTLAQLHTKDPAEEERLKSMSREQLLTETKKLPHSNDWDKLVKYFPERERDDRKLPSWIPKLSGAPFAMYPHAGMHITKLGRKNADPLVGDPRLSTNYNAAQGKPIDEEALRFRKRRWQDAHCMFVKGFILGKVAKTADSSQSGNIPAKWFKLAKWDVKDFENRQSGKDTNEPSEELWRTLVADRGKDGRNPPYYFSRACKESVFKGGLASGAVNTSDLINNERNSIVAEFCRRVQSVIWGRRLIKIEQGNLGLAASSVKKGDLVCILYGCTVPVVLRRVQKKPEVIEGEREEDELFAGLEVQTERAIAKLKALVRRKKRWQMLPEKVSMEEKERSKGKVWGKEDVRADLKEYHKHLKELEEKGVLHDSHERGTAQVDTQAKVQGKIIHEESHDCWYRFLGECYIHGMMDGEAIRMKTEHEDVMREEWNKKMTASSVFSASPLQDNSLEPTRADTAEMGEKKLGTTDLGESASVERSPSDTDESHESSYKGGGNRQAADDRPDPMIANQGKDEGKWKSFRGDVLQDMIFELR